LFGTVVYGFCLIAFYLSYGEVQIILKLVNDGLGGIATMGSSWSPRIGSLIVLTKPAVSCHN